MGEQDGTSALVESGEPKVGELQKSFKQDIAELQRYFHQCRRGYEQRRNLWAGKTEDLRKHGAEAFPWEGAADVEAPVIEEKIRSYIALFKQALSKANIRAYPTEASDTARAKLVSSFIKWMVRSYIKGFADQMERGGNYLLEKGLMVTYTGWEKQDRTVKQLISLEQIAEMSPDLAQVIQAGGQEAEIAAMLQAAFEGLSSKKAKKAVKELRDKGVAEFTFPRREINRPDVLSLAADSDVYWPAWCLDPQQSPRVSRRIFLTEQEIRGKVNTDGWDKDWAEYVIEHHKGVEKYEIEEGAGLAESTTLVSNMSQEADLYEVVAMYRRLIDPDDGSEGIYLTVFHPDFTGDMGVQGYATHELQDRLQDYPFVVTRLSEDHKRMYDLQTFPDQLRSTQWQVKVERDSRIDQASMETLPPLVGPPGRRPREWRPGGYVGARRREEYGYADRPKGGGRSQEIEQTLIKQADMLVGLDGEDPLSTVKQSFYIGKFLSHVQEVLRQSFKMYQLYGPDQIYFRVTGTPEGMEMQKGDPNEEFDINISFDVLNNDPEAIEKKVGQFIQLAQFDRNGKIDIDALLEFAAYAVDPIMADGIIQPSEDAQEQIVGKVIDDISKIYSGVEVGAQPTGAKVAMQVLQAYTSQPDIQQKVIEDEAFRERLEKYLGQYQMQLQQQENALTGQLGTAPAMFQGSNVTPA